MFQLKTIFRSFVAIVVASSLYSCHAHKDVEGTDTATQFCIPDSLLANITYDTLKTESVTSELTLSGKIIFNEDNVAKIFPLVSGHVTDVKVSLGDFVEKGKTLAVIRSSDMANYFNEFKSSQAELAIAKKNLDVVSDMRGSGVSSDKDFLVAQNEYQKALAQYNKINEVLKIYGSAVQAGDSTGSGYVIKAPISGFIVEKNITTGMELRPDQSNNIFTISDLKEVWAVANVFETDIEKIKEGSCAEITTLSYPDKKFSGKVDRISNILDPETKVMTVKIRLNNTGYTLKPGMFARIAIRFPESEKMLSLHSNAVLFDDNKNYVVRYREKCDVDMIQVNIYKSFNDKSFITSDSLREGDVVVMRSGLFVFTALKKL